MTRFILRCICNRVITKISLEEDQLCFNCGKLWERLESKPSPKVPKDKMVYT